MACKIVFFYRQFQQGFTETYYTVSNDPRTATNFSTGDLNAFLRIRHRSTVLDAIRASVVAAPPLLNAPRQFFLRLVGRQGISAVGETPDIVNATALCRAFTASDKVRHIWMRGLCDDQTVRDTSGVSQPGPLLQGALNQLFSRFANLGLSVQVLDPITTNPWRPVLSFQQSVLQSAKTTLNLFPGDPVPAVGDRVYFQNVSAQDMPGLTGIFIVQSTGVNSFTISYRFRNSNNPYFPPNANWRKATYSYPQITSLEFERFGDHDTGRPTVPSRGRRPARRLRH